MAYSAYLIMEENTFSNSALSYTLDSSNTNSNGEVIDEISENIPLSTGNSINHLGNWWWASTPSKFDLGVSNVFHVYSDGRIAGTTASMPGSLRPAISLKSNTKIVGLGTSLNPYVVD